MGEDKKSPIDEIRWEEKFHDVPVIFIFGANGRLGKTLTKAFFDNMGFHRYEVVPCYEKIKDMNDLTNFLKTLDTLFKGRNLYFFNCAALTNVQDEKTSFDVWEWTNAKMPAYIANYCIANKWKFIGISTDYIYQNVDGVTNNYVRSKKLFENISANCLDDGLMKIIRVANLFSIDEDDSHNLIVKFKNIIKNKGEITIDPELPVYPTDVSILAKKLVDMYENKQFDSKEQKYFNIISKKYKLNDFVNTFFPNTKINLAKSKVAPWDEKFENDKDATLVLLEGNDESIGKIIPK
jgi:dTDP-4-dehydrorhamnose reductase